jgi:hypothetical protein
MDRKENQTIMIVIAMLEFLLFPFPLHVIGGKVCTRIRNTTV